MECRRVLGERKMTESNEVANLLELKKNADKLKSELGKLSKNDKDYKVKQHELDDIVEKLWVELEDVPFIEDEYGALILDDEYLDFTKGTDRDDIWHWFDNMYSKGVASLLYDFDIDEHRKTESVSENTNEIAINKTIADTDFMKMLKVTPKDIIRQVKLSQAEFNEVSDFVSNYKGTFGELYKELGGWNLEYDNVEKVDDNYFDCYYKSLLITVKVTDGKLKVSPTDIYVYAQDISDVDTDELFHLDFDKPIDYSKINILTGESRMYRKTEDVKDIPFKKELISIAFPNRPYSEALKKLCKDGTLDLMFVINCFINGLPEETVKDVCQSNNIDVHMLDIPTLD